MSVYQCAFKGCSAAAVERLPGRLPRGAFLWRCQAHVPEPKEP